MKILKLFYIWQQRSSERRHLAELPAYLHKDMGLSASDVEKVVSKRLWKS